MPLPRGPPKRHLIPAIVFCALIFVAVFTIARNNDPLGSTSIPPGLRSSLAVGKSTLTGHAIAPKLGNETAKAELGRAAWKVLHTMMARFPDKPTEDESTALKSYIHLFQRLYPCGECAEHFGELLKKYPPQVSSRSAAAAWACHVHNKVNESLKKELFDCSNIGDFYDCGCAENDENAKKVAFDVTPGEKKPELSAQRKEKLLTNGRELNEDVLQDR